MATVNGHSLGTALVGLFEEQEECDITFAMNGQTIGAHQLVLKAKKDKCPILHQMVEGRKNKEKPIVIEDIEFETFKQFPR